ncbi:MAG: TRAM domain-containing protein, partial [Planctomycetes bacterium]|nr:TRAM domain-containing protein [Planctomycetota bacterium]
LDDNVTTESKKERNNLLLKIQSEISAARKQELIGQTLEVLVEGPSKKKPERQTGRTKNNFIVVFESDEDLAGQLVQVKIDAATALTLRGKIQK